MRWRNIETKSAKIQFENVNQDIKNFHDQLHYDKQSGKNEVAQNIQSKIDLENLEFELTEIKAEFEKTSKQIDWHNMRGEELVQQSSALEVEVEMISDQEKNLKRQHDHYELLISQSKER